MHIRSSHLACNRLFEAFSLSSKAFSDIDGDQERSSPELSYQWNGQHINLITKKSKMNCIQSLSHIQIYLLILFLILCLLWNWIPEYFYIIQTTKLFKLLDYTVTCFYNLLIIINLHLCTKLMLCVINLLV